MGPLEQQLEAQAKAKRWRLRWKSGPLRYVPRMILTELDIFRGKVLLTREAPFWIITSGDVSSREQIADMVLRYPSLGAGAQAA